jgi:hypothetical protein
VEEPIPMARDICLVFLLFQLKVSVNRSLKDDHSCGSLLYSFQASVYVQK